MQNPIFIKLEGATARKEDDQLQYESRDSKISINVCRMDGYYDHTILIDGYKIRVMETFDEITQKLKEVGAW